MKTLKIKDLKKTIRDEYIVFKSGGYRCADGTDHAIAHNESIHTSRILAESEVDNMELPLGFSAIVYSYTIKKIEGDSEEICLCDLEVWTHHATDIMRRNYGITLNPDGVLVGYTHVRCMNYAYNVCEVMYVRDSDFKTESDLINNSDSIETTYYKYFDNVNEISIEYKNRCSVPFNKMISGNILIKEFLK